MKAYNYDKSNEWKNELDNKKIYIIKHLQSTLPAYAQGRMPFLDWVELDLYNESIQLHN